MFDVFFFYFRALVDEIGVIAGCVSKTVAVCERQDFSQALVIKLISSHPVRITGAYVKYYYGVAVVYNHA